jgi:PAS domain S-box-containing protein
MRFLIIDDNSADRDLIRHRIRQEFLDVEIIEAATREAFEAALVEGGFDLVLCDYALQWDDGLTIIARIQGCYPVMPVIMLTDSGNEEVAVRAMKQGLSDYLLKRHLDRLPGAIRETLDRSRLRLENEEMAERLRLSEERYRHVSSTASDFAFAYRVTPAGECVMEWVTEAFYRITGYSEAEVTAAGGWLFMVHPEDEERLLAHRACVATGERQTVEYRVITRTRARRWLHLVCEPEIDPATGRVIRVYGAAQDITARKQTEESLIAERSLLRTLVDHLPVVVYLKDTAGRKTLSNPADVRYIGAMSEAEVLGKNDFDLYPPELAAAFYADDMHVIESGQPILSREETMTLPGGARGWQLTSKVPMHDSAGRVIGLVGIGQDITRRKQAEAEVRQLNQELEARVAQRTAELTLASERLALATEAAKIGIWDWDVRSDVLVWDETMRMLFGLAQDDFSGDLQGFLQCVHPEDVDRVAQHIHAVLVGEEQYEDEYRIVLLGGAIRYIDSKGSLTYNAYGEGVRVVGVAFDITERKRAELELQLFNEMMVGREQRVIELKEEVNLLSAELGRETPYPPIWDTEVGCNLEERAWPIVPWDPHFLGANTPSGSLGREVYERRRDILAASRTMTPTKDLE